MLVVGWTESRRQWVARYKQTRNVPFPASVEAARVEVAFSFLFAQIMLGGCGSMVRVVRTTVQTSMLRRGQRWRRKRGFGSSDSKSEGIEASRVEWLGGAIDMVMSIGSKSHEP